MEGKAVDDERGRLSGVPTAWGQAVSPERLNELKSLSVMQSDWEQEQNKDGRRSAVEAQTLTGADVFWLSAIALAKVVADNDAVDDRAQWLRYAAICEHARMSARLPVLNLEGIGIASEHLEYADLERANLAYATMHDAHLGHARLSKACLTGTDLVQTNMSDANLIQALLQQAEIDRACLQCSDLTGAHLEGALCRATVFYQANLNEAHLEGCDLTGAYLAGANLSGAFFDASTKLVAVSLTDTEHGAAIVADAHWRDVNLAVIDWTPFTELKWRRWWPIPVRAGRLIGDEEYARRKEKRPSKVFTIQERKQRQLQHISAYQQAARANRQLAAVLRGQGMNEEADYFAYRAQASQREAFFYRKTFGSRGQWLFSWFLCLLAGYGYKPWRTLVVYLTIAIGCAFGYQAATSGALGFGEALILSVSSFHGRGFFQPVSSLGDPVSAIAAIEAVIGLLIEASFIATFTQRFFGR